MTMTDIDLNILSFLNAKIIAIRRDLGKIRSNDQLLDGICNNVNNLEEQRANYIARLCKPINKTQLNLILASLDNYFRLEHEVRSQDFDIEATGAENFKNKLLRVGTRLRLFIRELLQAINHDSRDQVIANGRGFFMQSPTKLDTDVKNSTDQSWTDLKQSLELVTS